ncbi:MAG: phosphoribosylformylglycinamidine synthase I [Chloroflexota bacterium]|nr:phosphoribosylformylglycinamidine synthase I [Chloroflexota bacterium]
MHVQNKPRILVLRAAGINCDEETAAACELAGGKAERVHINRLASGAARLDDYAALVIPGGFSYGDHLGAGKLLAVDLLYRLRESLAAFVADGRPVLGICNGFQVLVKAGLLPGTATGETVQQSATLAGNANRHYECRWTQLMADPRSPCLFTSGMEGPFALPVGHGEGRFVADEATITRLTAERQVALRYVDAAGQPATTYPHNPNGSVAAIAGICNAQGNVFGLMPHPDRAYLPQLHPDWLQNRQQRQAGDGMSIFRNMLAYVTA